MQAILKRTAQVQKQAAKRNAKTAYLKAMDAKHERMQNWKEFNRVKRLQRVDERQTRRDDWLRGPLAAKKDVGTQREAYGAFDFSTFRPPDVYRWKDWGIVQGDRVCVVKKGHKDEGRIAKVTAVYKESEVCTVEGVNVVGLYCAFALP